MENEKIDFYLLTNHGKFPEEKIGFLKSRLHTLSDDRLDLLTTLKLKNPALILLASLLVGIFGVDRFLLGDTGLAIFKLLTLGGFGFFFIIDWFLVYRRAKEKNYSKVMLLI